MNITALFHKHSPFQSIQMPRRGCPHLRERVEHMRMQGTQLLWYPRSSHTWRLHNSGFGCHPEPLIWDSRSFLTGIGQGGATSSSVRSGNQSWFGQFGVMSITEAPFYFIFNIQPGCWPVRCQRVPLQPSLQRGVRQGDEQQAMCILELVANRSTSAAP